MKDDRQYWFPAKRYGWGWGPPTKWQGWAVLAVWTLLLIGGIADLGRGHPIMRTAIIAAMLVILLLICYLKGERPKWRWGKSS
jgi:hypothetical protein